MRLLATWVLVVSVAFVLAICTAMIVSFVREGRRR